MTVVASQTQAFSFASDSQQFEKINILKCFFNLLYITKNATRICQKHKKHNFYWSGSLSAADTGQNRVSIIYIDISLHNSSAWGVFSCHPC